MCNKRKLKQRLIIYTIWAAVIVSFVIILAVVQFKANGWKVNWQTRQITKTGMISLNGSPNNVDIYINGRIINNNLPCKINDLSPGNYDVDVSQKGYHIWRKTINVEPQKASIYSNIILFLEKPTSVNIPINITVDLVKNEFLKKTNDLTINETEIYFQNYLVTRFSDNILSATIYPDEKHIVLQVNNELRIIDIDGTNNILLATLSKAEATSVIFRENGRIMYYLDNDQVVGLAIR